MNDRVIPASGIVGDDDGAFLVPESARIPAEWVAAAESIIRSQYIKQQHPKRYAVFKALLADYKEKNQ